MQALGPQRVHDAQSSEDHGVRINRLGYTRVWPAQASFPFTSSVIDIRALPMPGLAEYIAAPLPSRTAGYQKRDYPPIPLVGIAVRCPQPVLFVHRTKDNVEGYEHNEDGAVRRHARQEQEEP